MRPPPPQTTDLWTAHGKSTELTRRRRCFASSTGVSEGGLEPPPRGLAPQAKRVALADILKGSAAVLGTLADRKASPGHGSNLPCPKVRESRRRRSRNGAGAWTPAAARPFPLVSAAVTLRCMCSARAGRRRRRRCSAIRAQPKKPDHDGERFGQRHGVRGDSVARRRSRPRAAALRVFRLRRVRGRENVRPGPPWRSPYLAG